MKGPRVFGFRFLALTLWGTANRFIRDDSWPKHVLFVGLYVLACVLIEIAYHGQETKTP